MNDFLPAIRYEFRRHKELTDAALVGLDDAAFFQAPGANVNSVALVVKHLAGNLRSRWSGFLECDGNKPDRDRNSEFVLVEGDTRESLLARWEAGWETLFATLDSLDDAALARTVTIREEPHTVVQALLRGVTHAAYHVGQILYLVRLLQPDAPWLTIPPGQSDAKRGGYLARPVRGDGAT